MRNELTIAEQFPTIKFPAINPELIDAIDQLEIPFERKRALLIWKVWERSGTEEAVERAAQCLQISSQDVLQALDTVTDELDKEWAELNHLLSRSQKPLVLSPVTKIQGGDKSVRLHRNRRRSETNRLFRD